MCVVFFHLCMCVHMVWIFVVGILIEGSILEMSLDFDFFGELSSEIKNKQIT